jgi:hypothetical protein
LIDTIPSEAKVRIEDPSEAFNFEDFSFRVEKAALDDKSSPSVEEILQTINSADLIKVNDYKDHIKNMCLSKTGSVHGADLMDSLFTFISKFYIDLWNANSALLISLVDCMFGLYSQSPLNERIFVKYLGFFLPRESSTSIWNLFLLII